MDFYGESTVEEALTVTPMMRVRRWRWWPFAHKYVPAERVRWQDMMRTPPASEVMRITGIGPDGMTVER